ANPASHRPNGSPAGNVRVKPPLLPGQLLRSRRKDASAMPRSCAVTTLATVVGVTLLVAGCSGDDAPADVAETPPAEESLSEASSEPALDINLDDDWTLAEGSGYQVGLPPGWFDAGRALADEDFMAEISRGIDDLIDDEGMQD